MIFHTPAAHSRSIFLSTLIFALLFSFCTFAQTLKTELSTTQYEGFKLAASTQYDDGTTKANLIFFSSGVRKKKVYALVTVKVYHAEVLLAHSEALQKEDGQALPSLKNAGPLQLRLTMLRDLTGNQISDSFKEALLVYDLDEKDYSQELKSVFKEISQISELKKGQVFSIAASTTAQKSVLLLQKPDDSIVKITGDQNFASQMLQIWFGTPRDSKKADPKLLELKKDLLKL